MACPFVVGVAAQYLQAHSQASPIEVGAAIVAGGAKNKISRNPAGTPNVLLNTLFLRGATLAPELPTLAPTTPPTLPITTIKIALHPSSSAYWLALAFSGETTATAKVEIRSASASTWSSFQPTNWGYFQFTAPYELKLPLSLRLTSSSGQELVLLNMITAFASPPIDVKTNYGVAAPVATPAPTPRPPPKQSGQPAGGVDTPACTSSPASLGDVSITQHPGVSRWWFAILVGGLNQQIGSVMIKDRGQIDHFSPMQPTSWQYYTFQPTAPLVAPLTVIVTSTSGNSTIFEVDQIEQGGIIRSGFQF